MHNTDTIVDLLNEIVMELRELNRKLEVIFDETEGDDDYSRSGAV